jgi:hypothetical protein
VFTSRHGSLDDPGALGVGIEDMRVYQANRARGHAAAAELVIHNERARTQLGWRPHPLETVIVESAESLGDLGLLA